MYVFTTLKANKEHNISYEDITIWCDESWRLVADLFENSEKYYWRNSEDYTDFDILYEDYTPRQVASVILKYMRGEAKKKDEPLMIWNKIFIELDCDGEIAYEQLKELCEDKIITGSEQLREIREKALKKGVIIKKEYYDSEHFFKYDNVDTLIDEYYPCFAEINNTHCNDCRNCC